MSLILCAAAYYRITLSPQDAYLALAESAMWLVLVLTFFVIPRPRR
jgi:hypothetical protein